MPETKFQSVVFTLMMVFCMVFCMTCYTVALGMGELNYSVFSTAIKEMWLEFALVFLLVYFAVTKLARTLALRIADPEKDRPTAVILVVSSLTVCMVVPSITLLATFIHHGFTGAWLTQWLQTAVLCFPAAYFLQIFFVGPFVRLIFRTLFKKRPAAGTETVKN